MITLSSKHFTLKIDDTAKVKSLILNATGEECLIENTDTSIFSLDELRPFNNELKLAHPNKLLTFEAVSLRREGDKLIAGFDLLPFEAVVEVKETDDYIAFTLTDFIIHHEKIIDVHVMDYPPVYKFRLIQLPVKDHSNFGEWLNVSFDENVAVNVLSTSPYADIDSEKHSGYRIMRADARKEQKLLGCGAALIVSKPDELLNCIESVEKDFNLPRGVEARRKETINRSIYWTSNICPENVDEHICFAKMGGFKMMLIYYPAFIRAYGYELKGDYVFNDNYPNGMDDLRFVLGKLKDAGISAGFHFLHTHIGIRSSYVTPVADHRLALKEYFSLSKEVSESDNIIYVEENPETAPTHPGAKLLKFDGEIISYESCSTEYPYFFKGCTRGHFNTNITKHNLGTIGGILDISEYGGVSIHINQKSSLQDEIADKIAKFYNAGFEFVYYDGSEGTQPPYSFNVPYAQYKVYKKFDKEPIFCEGAAKSHFSWHMLSGGNAFDVFPMNVFKKRLAEFPLEEAPGMANDFTRLNFGWWTFNNETQPDIYEYGTSKAYSWDCPVTVMSYLDRFSDNPRTEDIFEVLRRWEDARAKNIFTEKEKEMLRNADTEYTLLINENEEYELVPYFEIQTKNPDISAFSFERNNKSYVVCWHKTGSGTLTLPFSKDSIICEKELGGKRIEIAGDDKTATMPISGKMYISGDMPVDVLRKVF